MFVALIVLVFVFIGAVIAYAATRPDTMHVERSAIIQAPAQRIFPLINDFHLWGAWSPYEKLDPAMARIYSGADAGVGAVYEWKGNNKAGEGRMEITDSAAPSRIAITLDFIRPFEGHNIAQFTLVPQGNATTVTWAMDGRSPFMAKLMGLFINMDNMLGKDFAAGLANLKVIVEK